MRVNITSIARIASAFWVSMCLCVCAHAQDDGLSLEFPTGPVIAPATSVGLGGVSIGLAQGSGAQRANPAAVVNRYPYTGDVWFDWDWALDWLNVGVGGSDVDIENNGRASKTSDSVDIISAAFNLIFGRFGVGITLAGFLYRFCLSEANADGDCPQDGVLEISALESSLTMGYAFLDGELLVGGAFRIPVLSLTNQERNVTLSAPAFSVGALWRPENLPIRVGATFRSPIKLELTEDTGTTFVDLPVPRAVFVPWQFGVGVAYGFGPRALNPRVSFGDDETPMSERARVPMWREYLVLAADIVLIGPEQNAFGLDAWMAGAEQPAGRSLSVAWHVGAETEVMPRRLRLRFGAYFEPSRFEDVSGRIHGTAGLDLRLGELIWDWRFTTAVDVSSSYLNTMFSVGFWH